MLNFPFHRINVTKMSDSSNLDEIIIMKCSIASINNATIIRLYVLLIIFRNRVHIHFQNSWSKNVRLCFTSGFVPILNWKKNPEQTILRNNKITFKTFNDGRCDSHSLNTIDVRSVAEKNKWRSHPEALNPFRARGTLWKCGVQFAPRANNERMIIRLFASGLKIGVRTRRDRPSSTSRRFAPSTNPTRFA